MNPMKRTLLFLTDDSHDFADAQTILSEVELRQMPIAGDDSPYANLADFARNIVMGASEQYSESLFVVISALRLKGDDASNDRIVWKSCGDMSEAEFCNRFAGVQGVLTQALAFCENNKNVQIFQRDLPGVVSDRVSAATGSGFDCVWVPNGYRETLADLNSYNRVLVRRKRLYFDLANYLGLKTANDLYEVHVTVDCDAQSTIGRFEDACKDLGVKAIHIELPYGQAPSHLITGSFHKGPLAKIKAEAKDLAGDLSRRHFNVTRIKIEAMIRNSLVPVSDDIARTAGPESYFEFHVKVAVDQNTNVKSLMDQCSGFGVHLSRNASNKMADGIVMHFATLRVHDKGRDAAIDYFQSFLSHLRGLGYRLSNILQEYTVFDTNVSLDDGWFNAANRNAIKTLSFERVAPKIPENADLLLPPNKLKGVPRHGSDT